MNRRERQGAILRLVHQQELATQQEVAEALREQGHEVVQTTISRDIAELGLVKVRAASGRLAYAAPHAGNGGRREASLREAFQRWAITCESSANLVVVTTPPGFSGALAQEVDDSGHPHVLGTIAGENTVLVVAREGVAGHELRDELRGLMSSPLTTNRS